MKVFVAGVGGLVGRAVAEHCAAQGDQVLGYDHEALDISNLALVNTRINEQRPDYVINCAAWTDVDGCEFDRTKAIAANALGPENLAKACREVKSGLITISTDYVFDGVKDGFYTQRDDPHPLSIYGISKLQGEQRAQSALARSIVVRTGFIFGLGGKNFLSRVVDRARRGEQIKAISDAVGTPTYAPHLSARLRELALLDLPGIYHVVNAGTGASYEEFACEALEAGGLSQVEVETVTMASLNRPAPRPRNSRLSCLMTEAIGLAPLPSWREALTDFVVQESQPVTVIRS